MKSNLMSRRKRATTGEDPWVTDRDKAGDAKTPEIGEVPRVAARKTAQPAPPPADPAAAAVPAPGAAAAPAPEAAPAPAGPPANVDFQQMSSEALQLMLNALSGIKEGLLNDKAALQCIEVIASVLKSRPIQAAPAVVPKGASVRTLEQRTTDPNCPECGGAKGYHYSGCSNEKKAWDPQMKVWASSKMALNNWPNENPNIPHCPQCEMMAINGQNCHETGCPNEGKTWDPERQDWVEYTECPYCEGDVEVGQECQYCSNPSDENESMKPLWGGLSLASVDEESHWKDIQAAVVQATPYLVKMGVTPPGISEETAHEIKDEYPGDKEKAYATMWAIHNKKKEGSGNGGSWFVHNDETSEVLEGGERTKEIGEAHKLVDEKPAKLDRPATELPSKLGVFRLVPHFDEKLNTASRKSAAEEAKASTALKKVKKLIDKLQDMYLDAKDITNTNDTRQVREGVESIFRAADQLAQAAKVLGKQTMQEEAEKEALEVKEKASKKKGSLDELFAGLNIASEDAA